MLEQEGVHLIKFWLNVGRAEQFSRFIERERNPLKYWKLSWIDVEDLNRWDAYSDAIDETLSKKKLITAMACCARRRHAPRPIVRDANHIITV